jgi:hypothetical protein
MVSGIPIHIQPVYDYVLSLGISMVDKRLLCVLKGGEASTRLLIFVSRRCHSPPAIERGGKCKSEAKENA